MNYLLFIFTFIIFSPTIICGQNNDWHQRYRPSTVETMINISGLQHSDDECLKQPCYNFYGIYDVGYKFEMKYQDSIKFIPIVERNFIENWASVYHFKSYVGLFIHEALFSFNGLKYWIYIQEPTLNYYLKEL
jgi:hypothetical protein